MVDAGAVPLLILCVQEPEISLKRISASALSDISKHSPEVSHYDVVYHNRTTVHVVVFIEFMYMYTVHVHVQYMHCLYSFFRCTGTNHYVHVHCNYCTCFVLIFVSNAAITKIYFYV